MSPAPGFCLFRTIGRHFNSIKLPRSTAHELQERSRAAPHVQQSPGLLVSMNSVLAKSPSKLCVVASRCDEVVICIRIMKVHFFGCGWMVSPNQGAPRTAHQNILLLPAVKVVGSPQPLSSTGVPAKRTRTRDMTFGLGFEIDLHDRIRSWNRD